MEALQQKGPGGLLPTFFEWFGDLTLFSMRLLRSTFSWPYEWQELVKQMDEIGAKSVPLVALAGTAVGVVVCMQTRESLARLGAVSLLPVVIVLSIVRETGPIVTALILCGRVGARIGAELGSMQITEQIDAIEASAVDAHKLLGSTRVVACVLMLPLLTLFSDFFGVLMGWVAMTLQEPISMRLYFEQAFNSLQFSDLFPATLKTCVFGFIIGVIGCFQGMRAQGGTEGVGRATTGAVVLSSLFVILADVLLVRLTITFFA